LNIHNPINDHNLQRDRSRAAQRAHRFAMPAPAKRYASPESRRQAEVAYAAALEVLG